MLGAEGKQTYGTALYFVIGDNAEMIAEGARGGSREAARR